MALKLVLDNEVVTRRKEYIRCRLCGNSETRKLSNGERIWSKDKNIRGRWNGQFLCYDCYYMQDRVCCKCGTEQITKSVKMFRYYEKEHWIGKYICQDCYRKKSEDYKNKNILLKIGEGGGSLMDDVVSTVLDVPTYSIYIGDKRLPFSIIHEYYGIVGIKVSAKRYNNWHFNINDKIRPDSYFLIGLDKKLKDIQIVYIYPSERKNRQINIYRNSKKHLEFKVDHTPYDEIYKLLINKDITSTNSIPSTASETP